MRLKTDNPNELVKKINLLLADYLPEIYRYNNQIKHTKYYLKPVHIVIKKKSNGRQIRYYYYGRYWYRIEKKNNNGRKGIKWIYLGREKPDSSLPDPPENPLEGLVLKISDGEITVITSRKEMLELINAVLSSSRKTLEASLTH